MGLLISKITGDPVGGDWDAKIVDKDNLFYKKAMKAREDMTGWERVEAVFTRDEFGDLTPEMHRIKDATFIGLFVGAGVGGIGRSRIAYMDFFRQNVHQVFETPLQAKKALQDKVTLGMGSGAFRLGWRIAAFTFMYMTTSTAITAYRGKAGILDQVGGASTAGFLYKFRDGPKAAFAGTVVGGLLGVVSGSITLLAFSAFGMDFDSANLQYYRRLEQRMEREREATLKLREKTDAAGNLAKFHDQMLSTLNTNITSTTVVAAAEGTSPVVESVVSNQTAPQSS